eukprot:Phypoly_transcript_04898.p1 GENE.Phypoly_transcript_04898~~Phypoly_transcript_04898.p1  ORF type:complete len:687 (+),score=244.00 Phypoly_transcript_04898:259-2061(+)
MAMLACDEPPPKPVRRMVRVSEERAFRGKEFDARVHALNFLLTPSHFVGLLRCETTTHAQAQQLLAIAQEFGFVGSTVLNALLKFYVERADVPEALRVIELLRAHGVPYLERERLLILRAQRRARLFKEGTLRGEVIRMWAQLGDADMCMRCYTTMRKAGAHPGEPALVTLLRLFRERGDDAMCAQLLADMSTLKLSTRMTLHNAPNAHAEATGTLKPESFKTLLRYHAELGEKDVCARVLAEMRKRGMEEDDETRSILDNLQTKEEEDREPDIPQSTRRPRAHHAHAQLTSTHTHTPPSTPPTLSTTPATLPTTPAPSPTPLPSLYTPSALLSTPLPPPKSEYETEMEIWTQMKRSGEVPTSEFVHSLLHSASREGDADTCEELFAAMGAHAIERSAEAYASILEARKGDPARCEQLFAEMRTREIRPTLPAYNTMLWIFCAQRRNTEAFALFDEMKDLADTISYNTLMRVYAGDGNLQSVMILSAQMKERGVAHDAATYTIMVELLGKFGPKGMVVVDAVLREIEKSGIRPDAVLFDTLLDVYGGMGNWDQCEKVWHSMGGKEVLGEASRMRFLQRHCYKDPSIYVKWKKEFSTFLPP